MLFFSLAVSSYFVFGLNAKTQYKIEEDDEGEEKEGEEQEREKQHLWSCKGEEEKKEAVGWEALGSGLLVYRKGNVEISHQIRADANAT